MAESPSQQPSSIGVCGNVTGNIRKIIGQINILPQCNRPHLDELPPELINLLSPELRSAIRASEPITEMERSIHGEGSTSRRSRRQTPSSQPSTSAVPPSSEDLEITVDGAEEGAVLNQLLEKLKEHEIPAEDIGKMLDAVDVSHSPEQKARGMDELFRVLKKTGKLKGNDVIYLQCILWVAGRNDLLEVVSSEARRLQERYKCKISHLRTSIEKKKGYRCLHFHINVPVLQVTTERLRDLERTVALLLGVPVDFVAVTAVNLGSSAWVSVMVPEGALKTLVDALQKEEVQRYFAFLGVDTITFDSDILDVTPAASSGSAEEPEQIKKTMRDDARGRQAESTREMRNAPRTREKDKENICVLPPLRGGIHTTSKRLKTTQASPAKWDKEEDDEVNAVIEILTSQLSVLSQSEDPPTFLFHNVGITEGAKLVIVLHYRIGLAILQVEKRTSKLGTSKDAKNLKQARKVIAEATGSVLDYEDIHTAIASPNLHDPALEKWSQSPASKQTIHILPGKNKKVYGKWLQKHLRGIPSAWGACPDLYMETAEKMKAWHSKQQM